MKKLAAVTAVIVALIFGAGSALADDTSEANQLFVEAVKFVNMGEKAAGSKERAEALEKALAKFKKIIDDYPTTDLAVKLISGQDIGSISLSAVNDAIKEAQLEVERANKEIEEQIALAAKKEMEQISLAAKKEVEKPIVVIYPKLKPIEETVLKIVYCQNQSSKTVFTAYTCPSGQYKEITEAEYERLKNKKAASTVSNRRTTGIHGLEAAKRECAELGFRRGTERYGDCVLKLHKRSKVGAVSNNQRVEQQRLDQERRYQQKRLELERTKLQAERRYAAQLREDAKIERQNRAFQALTNLGLGLMSGSATHRQKLPTSKQLTIGNKTFYCEETSFGVQCRPQFIGQ